MIAPPGLPHLDPSLLVHHGWERIGGIDTAGRRSLWMRLTHGPDCDREHHAACGAIDDASTVTRIELRSGRERDDGYIAIDRAHPLFIELLGVLLDARFAVQT